MTWDASLPVGSESISNGDNRIRELKVDIATALGDEGVFPGPDTANPIFRYRGRKGVTGARPATGNYGLYFDETRQNLQRDNGSAWEDIGVNIPVGTKMLFIQAAVPTGWSIDATHDGRLIRVDGAVGNTTGGAADVVDTIALNHSHTVDGHTHTISNDGSHAHTVDSHTHTAPSHTHSTPAHTHNIAVIQVSNYVITGSTVGLSGWGNPSGSMRNISGSGSDQAEILRGVTVSSGSGTSGAGGTGATGGATPGTDSQGAHDHSGNTGSEGPNTNAQLSDITLKYVNVVVGTKD